MASLPVTEDQAARAGVRLDEWIRRHGPLSPESALVAALHVATAASRLRPRSLAEAVDSIEATNLAYGPTGWRWIPQHTTTGIRRVPDDEVIVRIGALLLHAMTGRALTYPLPGRQAIRAALRAERPQLPADVADLTVEALAPERQRGRTLVAFAHRTQRALGTDRKSASLSRVHRLWLTVTIVAAVLLALVLAAQRTPADAVLDHGLTRAETELSDFISEAAETLALIGEHTAAVDSASPTHSRGEGRSPARRPAPIIVICTAVKSSSAPTPAGILR
jgi:hypothetical protein